MPLSHGELFVVAFVVVAVVSAPWWPRLGAALGGYLAGGSGSEKKSRGGSPPSR